MDSTTQNLEVNVADAADLFALIFEPGDRIEFRALRIDDRKGRQTATFFRAYDPEIFDDERFIELLRLHDTDRHALYFTVCPLQGHNGSGKGGAAENRDIPRARCLWADVDGLADMEPDDAVTEVRERIENAGLPAPIAIVYTGGGCHVYWRLLTPLESEDGGDNIRRHNAAIANAIGGDRAATNAARILRVPGTTNRKRDPHRPVRLIRFDPAPRWELDKFPPPVEQFVSENEYDPDLEPDYANLGDGTIAFLKIDRIPESGTDTRWEGRNAALVAAAIDFKANNFPIEIALRELGDDRAIARDGLPEREAYRTIRNGYKREDATPSRIPIAYPADTDFAELLKWTNHSASWAEFRAGMNGEPADEVDSATPRISDDLEIPDDLAAGTATAEELVNQHSVNQNEKFDCNQSGKVLITQRNVRLALRKLGVSLEHNTFTDRTTITGLDGYGPFLDDPAIVHLRLLIDRSFKFLPARNFLGDILLDEAMANRRHPVREYLDGLEWDGTPRLDTWLNVYAGAGDNAYTRAVGAITLIAAVRRVRRPGVKFDTMLVMEGPQGTGKSSLLATLAVNPDWFSDDLPLGTDSKLYIERTAGSRGGRAPHLLLHAERKEKEHADHFRARASPTSAGPALAARARCCCQ